MDIQPSDVKMYYLEFYKQISFISALLAGFSFSAIISSLGVDSRNNETKSVLLLGFYISSAGYILATIASSYGVIAAATNFQIYQSVDNNVNSLMDAADYILITSVLLFFIGSIGLAIAIGASGFIKSKSLGYFSTFISFSIVISFVLIMYDFLSYGQS